MAEKNLKHEAWKQVAVDVEEKKQNAAKWGVQEV